MGTNNRQRRAAKTRKRVRRESSNDRTRPDRRREPQEPGARRPFPGDAFVDDGPRCECFECRLRHDRLGAIRSTSSRILSTTGTAWRHGWQPSELVRQIRRSVSTVAADLMTIAVIVDDGRRSDQTTHSRWQRQIDFLSSITDADAVGDDWLELWLDGSTPDQIRLVDGVLGELGSLRGLHRLIPPPGETETDGVVADDDTDDPVLARVRALLAQAESTTFPAEAEVFTAKAQALMSRHSIDEAMIRHAAGNAGRPVSIRLPIDDPYVSEKSSLLHVVADAGRCQAIGIKEYAMSTVIGDAVDVRRVELLFTSLLLQAQAALNHEAAQGGAGSHRRSRSFRSAFLAGYASRIGDRLIEERDRAVADSADDVLPVLARQSQAVDDEIERLFGSTLTSTGGRVRDRAGWNAGSDAADRARLREGGLATGGSGRPVEGLPAAG